MYEQNYIASFLDLTSPLNQLTVTFDYNLMMLHNFILKCVRLGDYMLCHMIPDGVFDLFTIINRAVYRDIGTQFTWPYIQTASYKMYIITPQQM